MSNASILPPDLREQMKSQSAGGIGAAAAENAASASAREVAVNPAPETAAPAAKVSEEREELQACPACRKELKAEWVYCAACGADLIRGGPAKKLGIKFTEEDMTSYLFRGYVVRELPVLGKHKITVKSSQPKDLEAIDNYIMNGDWGKKDDGSERRVSDFYLRQMNALCVTASAVTKVDGESIGDSLEKRLAWMNERGSSFVDIVSQRVTLFNQALTEFLRSEDSILGS